MKWDSLESAWNRRKEAAQAHWDDYLGFYSSWLGGYFREPWGMAIPLDDHGFHRGDGVFEAVRIHARAYIDLPGHLRRLENSARAIEMRLPWTADEIGRICIHLASLCDSDSGILRLYATRGPGGFSPSPAEVVGHQLYAAITRFRPVSAEKYQRGVSAMISTVQAKDARWAQIKSCNYLQNVLMKKESLDRGFDFALSVDGLGRICEGATENLLVVTRDSDVLVPKFDYTLRGTTVTVVMGLAEELKLAGKVCDVRLADLTVDDVRSAREAAFVGTTLGVLPVTSLDRGLIGDGRPGQVVIELQDLLLNKMATDTDLRTPF